ncbi:putative non-specific serine/threonine protein kinase [Helianthus annuus]|nr:putative non-specific serine/threonine protein kinase [Helianthus annuus]
MLCSFLGIKIYNAIFICFLNSIVGNPMICGSHANEGCYGSTLPEPLSFNLNPSSGKNKSKKVVVALGISLGCLVLLLASLGVLLWKRGRNQKQSILDINGIVICLLLDLTFKVKGSRSWLHI